MTLTCSQGRPGQGVSEEHRTQNSWEEAWWLCSTPHTPRVWQGAEAHTTCEEQLGKGHVSLAGFLGVLLILVVLDKRDHSCFLVRLCEPHDRTC